MQTSAVSVRAGSTTSTGCRVRSTTPTPRTSTGTTTTRRSVSTTRSWPTEGGRLRSVETLAAGVVAALSALHLAAGLERLFGTAERAEARVHRPMRIAIGAG